MNCELLHLDSVELVLSAELPCSITRNVDFEMQVLMLQHGDFCERVSVAEPSVHRVGVAADEELRDLMLVMSPNISDDSFFF